MAASSEELYSQVLLHLNEAQDGLHLHHKLLISLKSLLAGGEDAPSSSFSRVKDFYKVFLPMLQNCLLVLKREAAAERLIEFVAKFTVSVARKKPAKIEKEEEEEDSYLSSSSEEEEGDKDDFFNLLIRQLIEYLNSSNKAVRFRSCQLISKIFSCAHSDSSNVIQVSSALSNELVGALMHRLMDKVQLVRLHAVSALTYFQDPTDADCTVTSGLVWSMCHDTSPDVRKCALVNVLVTKVSLPSIIERTRDIKESVRRPAYLKLAESVSIRNLTIEQRIQLVNDGLRDESEKVKEACIGGLLRKWCIELDDDLLQLLRRLDVENCPDIAELVLFNLFEDIRDEEVLVTTFEANLSSVLQEREGREEEEKEEEGENEKDKSASLALRECLIPLEDLSCEMVFYWRCLSKYFKMKPEGEGLGFFDRVAPTLSNFCSYLKSFMDINILTNPEGQTLDTELSLEFIAQQLCGMLSCLDFTDEMGKRLLGELIYQLIVHPVYPTSLVSPILKEQALIWPQVSSRTDKFLEMIVEIRSPDHQTTVHGLTNTTTTSTSLSLNTSSVCLKDDPACLIKCLAVAGELFRDLKLTRLTPSLIGLVDSLLLPCFQNENPYVRDMAVFSLGLACLVDVSLARRHILLFLQAIQVDHENVKATSLKVVFDMLHLYGLEAFNLELRGEAAANRKEKRIIDGNNEEEGEEEEEEEEVAIDKELTNGADTSSGQKFLQILTSYLNGESTLLRQISAEGSAKLLLSRQVISVPLLVQLLLIWYNPIMSNEDTMRSTLGHFFPLYAASDVSCRVCIAETYIPVMQAVYDAPPTSPLMEVDVTNMASFIVSLSSPHQSTEDSSHDDLSVCILNHLLSKLSKPDDDDDDIEWHRLHSHTLTLLTLSPHNTHNNRDVLVLLDQLNNSTNDKKCLKDFQKFRNMLNKLPMMSESNKENATSGVGEVSVSATPTTGRSRRQVVMSESQLSTRRRRQEVGGDKDDEDEDFLIAKTVKKSAKKKPKRPGKGKIKTGELMDKGNSEGREGAPAEEEGEESDDSILGDSSPFVRSFTRSERERERVSE